MKLCNECKFKWVVKERKDSMLEGLKKYFRDTTPEQIKKDWEEVKEFDTIGPTVEEFFKANNIGTEK